MIAEKLMNIQQELKAPKNQRNSFGNYNYRSCEDILEAVKPLLVKYECILTLSDELVQVGDRYYVKATARLRDIKGDSEIKQDVNGIITTFSEDIVNTAYARESETKKGMDDSQITGTASSYARKYALNGLFCIDDTKDADTNEYQNQTTERKATAKQIEILEENYEGENLEKLLRINKLEKLEDISLQKASELISKIYQK